ncbi:hypothetical protein HMPREF0908_1374 [Selenomonas flueggei ATCC 43531]|uniref:Uncharacterized protein n=1 Tax=Selenomonas flueggei ATCC 43531 TaxID=638302 RepID=C4V4D0_9FIRM|nr:hypothetical protein HMPREF0908_1374 [Selenomonas flueggei ATCC 43531]
MTLFYFAVFLDIEEVLINSAIDAFFCPHFGGKSSAEQHAASHFPLHLDEKSTLI